jgi:hypothetical protein
MPLFLLQFVHLLLKNEGIVLAAPAVLQVQIKKGLISSRLRFEISAKGQIMKEPPVPGGGERNRNKNIGAGNCYFSLPALAQAEK